MKVSLMCKICSEEEDPCCLLGPCTAISLVSSGIGMCECCGAEMFEEKGFWFHHSQENIPFDEREPQYFKK